MTAKFPGTCTACKRAIKVGDLINWRKGFGAAHASAKLCAMADAVVFASRPTITLDAKPIADFIAAAKARGLKFPKARFLAPGGGELKLSVAGNMSKAPGSIQVKLNGNWIGRIEPDAKIVGRELANRKDLRDALDAIAADPATAATAYGTLMVQCSFCNLPLENDGSTAVGYGKRCAQKWGLPHTTARPRPMRELPLAA